MTQPSHDTFAAFIGIDWADAKHEGCLQAAGTATREGLQLAHTPEAIDVWVTTLRTRFHGQPVAVCLALDKGPLVSALRTYAFLVLFPIKPLTLARSREACTLSRAKDDPTDAALQLALLLPPSRQAPPPHAAERNDACAHPTRRTPPPRGGRQRPDDQAPDQYAQEPFPTRAALVSGQRYPDLVRLPEALATPEGDATRPSLHPRKLFPGPSCALSRGHCAPYPGHQSRPPPDHG